MKSISKAISIILVLTLLTCTAVFADLPPVGTIEIIFNVGDSILSLNGIPTEVETPFVVGGVTMVPLRVISEAFGAKVDWEDATQKITLTYDETTIVLQINNKTAQVNGQNAELLEAPTLSVGGRTMVPLRFIAETFGAIVAYDEKTEGIKVSKTEGEEASTGTVTSALNKAMIGDSYHGWSADTPKIMTLEERTFDGAKTIFVNNDDQTNLTYFVDIIVEEDFTLDKALKAFKTLFGSFTLVKAEKLKDTEGQEYIVFQARAKDGSVDICSYLKNGKQISQFFTTKAELSKEREKEYQSILSTYSATFKADDDIEDMSNVIDGYRQFTDKKYKLSLKLPADWRRGGSENQENYFNFYKYDKKGKKIGSVAVGIFSANPKLPPEKWAARDMEYNTEILNEKHYELEPVSKTIFNNKTAYEYTITHINDNDKTSSWRDIFFIDGEYGYNVRFDQYTELENADEIFKEIEKEYSSKPLDSHEIGQLAAPDFGEEGTITIKDKENKLSMTIPDSWEQIGDNDEIVSHFEPRTGSTIYAVSFVPNQGTPSNSAVMDTMEAMELEQFKEEKEIVEKVNVLRIGENVAYSFSYKEKVDDKEKVFTQYLFTVDGVVYNIITSIFEEYYGSKKMDQVISDILASFKVFK